MQAHSYDMGLVNDGRTQDVRQLGEHSCRSYVGAHDTKKINVIVRRCCCGATAFAFEPPKGHEVYSAG